MSPCSLQWQKFLRHLWATFPYISRIRHGLPLGGGPWLPFSALVAQVAQHSEAPAAWCAGADPTASCDRARGPEIWSETRRNLEWNGVEIYFIGFYRNISELSDIWIYLEIDPMWECWLFGNVGRIICFGRKNMYQKSSSKHARASPELYNFTAFALCFFLLIFKMGFILGPFCCSWGLQLRKLAEYKALSVRPS